MKFNSYIQLGLFSTALLIASCGDGSGNSTKSADVEANNNTEQVKPGASKDEASKGDTKNKKELTKKEMTSDAGLNSDEIDALYNDPVIDANGKERPVNSITAFEYLRYDEDTEKFSEFVERYSRARTYLEEKDNIVLLVPTDNYLIGSGNETALMDIWDAKDFDAMKQVLESHVQILEGKYIGGDFIYMSDLIKGKVSQIRKKNGKWHYKTPLVSDPILVRNGIIFKMEGAYLPAGY